MVKQLIEITKKESRTFKQIKTFLGCSNLHKTLSRMIGLFGERKDFKKYKQALEKDEK